MASVDWQKTNIAKLARMGCHFDNGKREKVNHTNKDIDKTTTNSNYYLGAGSYKEIMERADEYIQRIDRQFPPKKKQKAEERITMASLEFVCPREVTDMGLSEKFFDGAEAVLKAQFGAAYMGGVVHLDEIHDYYDPSLKQMVTSCEHVNAWVCCHAKWQDAKGNAREGINGKNFVTREAMISLNNAMHEMCLEHFGVPYLTGGEARNVSVERLKQDSYKALNKEIKIKQREILNLTNERDEILRENAFLRDEVVQLQQQIVEIEQDKIRGEKAVEKLEIEFEKLESQLKSKELELHIKTEAYEKIKIEYEELLDNTIEKREEIEEKKAINRWNRENSWERNQDIEYGRW